MNLFKLLIAINLFFIGSRALSQSEDAPIAHFYNKDQIMDINRPLELDASGSYSPTGHLVKYEWYVNGLKIEEAGPTEFNQVLFRHHLRKELIALVKLVVTDNYGKKGMYEEELIILPQLSISKKEIPNNEEYHYISASAYDFTDRFSKHKWRANGEEIKYATGPTIELKLEKEKGDNIEVTFQDIRNKSYTVSGTPKKNQKNVNVEENDSKEKKVFADCLAYANYVVNCESEILEKDNYKRKFYNWSSEGQTYKNENATFLFDKEGEHIIKLNIKEERKPYIAEREFRVNVVREVKNEIPVKNDFIVKVRPSLSSLYKIWKNKVSKFEVTPVTMNPVEKIRKVEWYINDRLVSENNKELEVTFDRAGRNTVSVVAYNQNEQKASDQFVVEVKDIPFASFKKEIDTAKNPTRVKYSIDESGYVNGEIRGFLWRIERNNNRFDHTYYYGEKIDFLEDRPGSYKVELYVAGDDQVYGKYDDEFQIPKSDNYIVARTGLYEKETSLFDKIKSAFTLFSPKKRYDHEPEYFYLGDAKTIKLHFMSKDNEVDCHEIKYEVSSNTDLNHRYVKRNCEIIINYDKPSKSIKHEFKIKATYKDTVVERIVEVKTRLYVSSIKLAKVPNQERLYISGTNTKIDGSYIHFPLRLIKENYHGVIDIYKMDNEDSYRLFLKESSGFGFKIKLNDYYKLDFTKEWAVNSLGELEFRRPINGDLCQMITCIKDLKLK